MIRKFVAPVAVLSFAAFGQSAVIWDEGLQGDLTGNWLAPQTMAVSVGTNTIIGTTGDSDRDYFHFSLAQGQSLTGIYLRHYAGLDDVSFLAVQEGTFITEDPQAANVANLLGWTFFGSPQLNSDLLPGMGTNWGSIGFTPPLTGSDYSFWLQQTGDFTEYALEFHVVPEPATIALVGGFATLALRKRKARTQ